MAKFYLAGPFWNDGCQQFFNKFIERINETKMNNLSYTNDKERETKNMIQVSCSEDYLESLDKFFAPGHFEVNFQKIRSEYSESDMKRVLNQVLDLDLNQIDKCDSMIAYIKERDLGTLVEIGYFLRRFINPYNYVASYFNLKKSLLFEGDDDKIKESIDVIIRYTSKYIDHNYSDSELANSVYVIDGIGSILNWNNTKSNKQFNIAAIRLGNYDEPINAIMAGYLYASGIPFLTYTTDNSVKNNVMMIAASLGHMNLSSNKLDKVERSALSWLDNIKFNVWSNESINSSKEIK